MKLASLDTQSLQTVSDELEIDNILDLVEGRILAVRIPNYYPGDLSLRASERLLNHPRFGHYSNASDIGRVAMAYFETVGADIQAISKYYGQVRPAMKEIREAFEPYSSPMDKLRVELQEIWPVGANLENLDGRGMFAGLVRVFERGSQALPHRDLLKYDAPHYVAAYEQITQLGANIYLKTSPAGGELQIWGKRPNEEEHRDLKLSNSYGLDRKRLPEPDLIISPKVGDLILFEATRIHAVSIVEDEPRVTISCFIGYMGRTKALSYWS